MTISSKRLLGGVAAAGLIVGLAACAPAPEKGEGAAEGAADFVPCIVSDAGGFDDRSFNQLSYEGVQ